MLDGQMAADSVEKKVGGLVVSKVASTVDMKVRKQASWLADLLAALRDASRDAKSVASKALAKVIEMVVPWEQTLAFLMGTSKAEMKGFAWDVGSVV